MRATRILLLGSLLLAVCGEATAQAPAPQVSAFWPQGTIKGVRQVQALFSVPMVPLGDPRLSDPFEISCPETGTGRWVDTRIWVYDFTRDLPAGIRCTFRLRPGLQSLDGEPLTGALEFPFSTGGPAIRSSQPREGSGYIAEDQAFILELDAQATPASMEAHVRFRVVSLPDPIGIRILGGSEREAILKSRYASRPRPDNVVVIQARQRFPNANNVTLVWGKGVASTGGVETDQDQTLNFSSRGPFTLAFECLRENPRAQCVPVAPMRLDFGGQVAWDEARRIVLIGPDGTRRSPEREEVQPFVSNVTFKGPFPEKATFSLEIPAGLKDDAGRSPINAAKFPLAVKTDAFPPLAKFAARFGILERNADPALPVTLRNLEPAVQVKMLGIPSGPSGLREWMRGRILRVPPDRGTEILSWLRTLATAGRERSMFASLPAGTPVRAFSLPKPHGSEPMEVVGIPLKDPGLYVVEIESARLGAVLLAKPAPMFVPAGALVTNLSAHFKWGREGSLVWVTTLDRAQPVRGAHVSVFDCNGTVLWKGPTDAQGVARPVGLPSRDAAPQCAMTYGEWNETVGYLGGGLFVTAQTADDLSFVHSSWEQGIESWRFNLPTNDWQGPLNVQTVLDRPLFRAGEVVSMKHLIRRQALRGLAVPTGADRPGALKIRHEGSEEEYELPLSWDAAGIAESTWQIPKGAKLGRYEIQMEVPGEGGRRSGQSHTVTSGRFRVEEFRVPLMRGTLKPPGDPLVAVSEFPVDISVQYLAGGGASKQPVTVRAQLSPRPLPRFDLFEDFTFANGSLAPGITRRSGGELEYEDEGTDEDAETRAPERAPRSVHQREDVTLDGAGTARVSISKLPRSPVPQDVLAEVEFRDPNGEVLTAATRVPVWPARWLVGLKPESWAASRDGVKVTAAVVDLAGKPVAQVPVRIEMLERKSYANRKRLVGGFYAYEYVQEVKRLGELCSGMTDARGLMPCTGKTAASGQLILQARIQDGLGHAIAAHQEIWVAGSEEWWFEVRDSDRIDLLPEQKRYEPGETATLQVRMPFREATALVTVEREGVLEAMVVPLSGREPVITVPVKGDYAPNVFVSALVVRGRVGGVQPTAMVDLGRPAHKLGITELRVGWRAHELKVTVSPDRQVYQIREKARVRIRARTADGKAPPAGSEVALAAVDEGLLELARNPSWDLLESMMRRRPYLVETSTAQGQVVGRRHFGLKALPQGGGGGRQGTRELFDTLLLWRARVALDAGGEATVDVPLNDSLTSFRIVAVATGGAAMFGTGSASIRSTRDLMVLPGIAPLARQRDRMRPEVTIRNTTEKPFDVTVTARAEGLKETLAPRSVTLAGGEARTVGWDLTVPAGISAIKWEIEAAARGGPSDRVHVSQQVISAVPVRTYQATLAQWERTLREAVERPVDALPGQGGIRVQLRRSLVDGMSGVRDWMREYPYDCLEQQVSRAVALRDLQRWRGIMAALPSYLDGDGLLKYFPTGIDGSEVLTSYVLAVANEAGWSVPDGTRDHMEQGLKKFVTGAIARRRELETADLSIRKLQAIEALSRFGKAEVGLLASVSIEPNLWPTSAVLDWWSLLSRMPGVPDRDRRLAEAEQIVRARLTMQGTVMKFSTEATDGLWWLMVSPDVNAVRLVLHLVRTKQWQQDVPRLMGGALARQRRGAWNLTLANAWGVLAVEKFSAAYEKTPVTGTTTAALGPASRSVDWTRAPKGAAIALPWPPGREEIVVDHAGTGRPWVTLQARAAIPLKTALSSGYAISKSLAAVEQKQAGAWSRGDIVRVRLEVEAQSDMTWVVINDPIPAGASHLGSGLGGQSRIALTGEQRSACPCLAFEERAFDGVRAYYPYVRKGVWVYEYTIRLNQSGRFELPTTRVEALYAPEVFGELPNPPLEVKP